MSWLFIMKELIVLCLLFFADVILKRILIHFAQEVALLICEYEPWATQHGSFCLLFLG